MRKEQITKLAIKAFDAIASAVLISFVLTVLLTGVIPIIDRMA